MGNVIHVKNASLRTATIQIKHLMLDGRKLTLAAFKQIPEEDIIDFKKAKLNGIPWGIVNYPWSDLKKQLNYKKDTIQILWQKGNELRRALVNRFYDRYYTNYEDIIKNESMICTKKLFEFHKKFERRNLNHFGFVYDPDTSLLKCWLMKSSFSFIDEFGKIPQLPVLDLSEFPLGFSFFEPKVPNSIRYNESEENKWKETNEEWKDWKRQTEKADPIISEYVDKINGLIHTTTKSAYTVYKKNHLDVCNQLVEDLVNMEQIYIAV